ncbi:hypothetical protein AK812_SmicGene14832 [Symbiodinium microadriaticum]|uniref:EF-hand domain-containing protein n=1 Tax=Symbiodinium microadriaticum TaxID=2951 RepID=A0A1Q9E4L5_SYMMI|nr:hypothetical protein AK812_SmicGene14832 [Symbiodinium microadriaticum]
MQEASDTRYDGRRVTADLDDKQERNKRRKLKAKVKDKEEEKRPHLGFKVYDKTQLKTVNRKLLRAATTKIFQAAKSLTRRALQPKRPSNLKPTYSLHCSSFFWGYLLGDGAICSQGEGYCLEFREKFYGGHIWSLQRFEVDEKLKELEDLEDLPPPPAALRRKESVSMMRRFSRQISDDEPEIVAMRLGSRKAVTATDFDARTRRALAAGDLLGVWGRGESRDSRMSSKATANVPKADVWDTYQRADDAKSDQLMENLKKDPTEDIFELLTFLGCVFLDRVEVRALMDARPLFTSSSDGPEPPLELALDGLMPAEDKTTKYDYMAFDDFESFMVELGENGEDGSMLAGPPVLSLSSSAVSRRPAATDQSAELIARAELMLQVIFDRFDEDGSGTISIEELREMLHYLGFMPNRRMIQDFDQLVLFLLVYRRREGFCRAEAQYSDGDPPLMPVSMLGAALKQAFGRQVHDFAAKVQEQLQKGILVWQKKLALFLL